MQDENTSVHFFPQQKELAHDFFIDDEKKIFAIHSELGTGSLGSIIYLAQNIRTKEFVAIKKQKNEEIAIQESTMLQKIFSSPIKITTETVGATSYYWLVQPLIDGTTFGKSTALEDILRKLDKCFPRSLFDELYQIEDELDEITAELCGTFDAYLRKTSEVKWRDPIALKGEYAKMKRISPQEIESIENQRATVRKK